jgi:predicted permease
MHQIIQDLRYGLRLLLKSPIFTVVAVLSLAIGIGASTSIFSFFNEKLLSPLPAAVKDPDRLMRIYTRQEKIIDRSPLYCSYSEYAYYKDQNPAFSDMLAYANRNRFSLHSGDDAAYIEGSYVSGNYFSLLGIQPCMGRNIAPDDDRPENNRPVAVISYAFWKKFFKLDPSIAGREIQLNRMSFVVIGVAPEKFTGIDSMPLVNASDIFVPLAMKTQLDPNIKNLSLQLIGRLKPGKSLAQAQTVMQVRFKERPSAYSSLWGVQQIFVSSANQLDPMIERDLLKIWGLVLVMTVIILWIPCANVSSLLLVRAIERRKEIAVRAALGAGRRRIIRQLLTEALLLGAFAGAVGPLLATWIIPILAGNLDSNSLFASGLNLDKKVLCFTIVLSILTSMVFGLIPALHTMRINLTSALKDQENSKFKVFRFLGARNLLVILNIAGSLAVLAIAGLIIQRVEKSNRVELPLNPDTLLTIPLHLNPNEYLKERARQFNVQLMARLQTLPRIHSAGIAGKRTFLQRLYTPGNKSTPANIILAGKNYFRSINTQIVRGRDFSTSEFQSPGDGVIVNETTARLFWPGQEALGRQLQSDLTIFNPGVLGKLGQKTMFTVIGIVRDSVLSEDGSISGAQKPIAYLPLPETSNDEMTLFIRTVGNAKILASSIRQIISDLEPGLPITSIQTLSERIETSKKQERYGLILLIALGFLALGLACMGLYAVVSYAVGRRTQEIGIRIALGAAHTTVLRQLIGEGLQLTAIGLMVGLFAAWAIARFMESSDIPITPSDPLMYLAACLLLIPVAVGACYLPARKAVRANPMTALKYE